VVDAKTIGATQQVVLLLDVPVLGGVVGVQATTLIFMAKKP
jgi:3-hydroxyisobutyrate dehydrogenase-like beta-hydroxyacid dehydrogenase